MIETGLKEKVVIVTGAAAGIGLATAERFVAEGCKVAAWDVNEAPDERSDRAVWRTGSSRRQCGRGRGRGRAMLWTAGARSTCWSTTPASCATAQLVKFKDGEVGRRMTDEAWDAVINVNLKGVFHCTRAVVPHMIAGGGGAILNASSVACLNGNFGQTNYVATKAGVIGMTKTWARELGRFGIRVNAVAPGFVKTEILNAMPEKVTRRRWSAHTPMGRIGDTDDIAEAYVWLASDAATWVTGTTLSVDGGLVIGT